MPYPEITIPAIFAIIGFITGWIARSRIGEEKRTPASEYLAWVFSLAWLSLHGYGLVSGKFNIPWAFDIVGAMTIGHVLGFDIKEVISAVKKK